MGAPHHRPGRRLRGAHLTGIALDEEGRLYVTSPDGHIDLLDARGTLITRWRSSWQHECVLWSPVGVALDSSGQVTVADASKGRLPTFRVLLPVTS